MSESESTTATTPAAAPRRFIYNGQDLPDIDPTMTVEQVRDFWAGTYPELQNATQKGPDKTTNAEGVEVKTYTFTRNVGHLG